MGSSGVPLSQTQGWLQAAAQPRKSLVCRSGASMQVLGLYGGAGLDMEVRVSQPLWPPSADGHAALPLVIQTLYERC